MRKILRALRLVTRPHEAFRILAVLRVVERDRLGAAPKDAVERARMRGRAEKSRSERRRMILRRAIVRIDSLMPDGGNCYRRALIETSLDPVAAEEKIYFGLDVGKTGHAWLASDPERRVFDVTFAV